MALFKLLQNNCSIRAALIIWSQKSIYTVQLTCLQQNHRMNCLLLSGIILKFYINHDILHSNWQCIYKSGYLVNTCMLLEWVRHISDILVYIGVAQFYFSFIFFRRYVQPRGYWTTPPKHHLRRFECIVQVSAYIAQRCQYNVPGWTWYKSVTLGLQE